MCIHIYVYNNVFLHLQPFSAQVATMAGRAKGTVTDGFDPEAMIHDLGKFAKVKDCAFDFELCNYAKTRRSQAADREGLAYYSTLLTIILAHAPHGYPSLLHLKIVWKVLQDKFQVMSKELFPIYNTKLDAWSSLCCEKVRLACRHVVDLKRSQTTFVSREVQSLMDLVVLRHPALPHVSSPIATARSSSSIAPPSPNSTESDLICCGFTCQCVDCKPTPDITTVQGSSTDGESETSLAAHTNCEHVPANRGGQKRAAEQTVVSELRANPPRKKVGKQPAAERQDQQPAAEQSAEQVGPHLKIVSRNKPENKRESYIMKDGRFLIACKESSCASCKAVISTLVKEMKEGSLDADKDKCKTRLTTLMASSEL
jgi:hypothetical protein